MKKFSNNTIITQLHIEIARKLFRFMDKSPDLIITYGELANPLGINPQNLRTYLGDLSTECHSLGLPLISAIVVNADTLEPGFGFFTMAHSLGYSSDQIENAKTDVFACRDWTLLKDKLAIE